VRLWRRRGYGRWSNTRISLSDNCGVDPSQEARLCQEHRRYRALGTIKPINVGSEHGSPRSILAQIFSKLVEFDG
jgi:hypothetical protein